MSFKFIAFFIVKNFGNTTNGKYICIYVVQSKS